MFTLNQIGGIVLERAEVLQNKYRSYNITRHLASFLLPLVPQDKSLPDYSDSSDL